jgi:hypothetical protein
MQSQSGEVRLQELPVELSSSSSGSDSRKRAILGSQNITGVTSGAHYSGNNQNVTIFGGHFSATSTDGSTIENLMFLNGSNKDAVTGAPSGLDADSTILTLGVSGDLLWVGGKITGQLANTAINGLVLYDMATAGFRTVQPAALQGDNVIVNAISPQPGKSAVYVGGDFDSTSQGLTCASVCMYDTATSQWSTVGGGLGGTVSALFWTADKTLLAAGNLTVQNNETSLATYDTDNQVWTVVSSAGIPGPVSAFCPATENGERMWVAGTATNGSTFLVDIDRNNNRPVLNAFETGTTIEGLQIMPLSQSHGATAFMDKDQVLLVTGQLNISGFGNAAAAYFNGTNVVPLILASTSNGDPGSISQVFSSKANNLKSNRKLSLPLRVCFSNIV